MDNYRDYSVEELAALDASMFEAAKELEEEEELDEIADYFNWEDYYLDQKGL